MSNLDTAAPLAAESALPVERVANQLRSFFPFAGELAAATVRTVGESGDGGPTGGAWQFFVEDQGRRLRVLVEDVTVGTCPTGNGDGSASSDARCALCEAPALSVQAQHIGLAGFSFRLPLCDVCATRGGIEDMKEAAVVAYARLHPETKGLAPRGTEIFVALPEAWPMATVDGGCA